MPLGTTKLRKNKTNGMARKKTRKARMCVAAKAATYTYTQRALGRQDTAHYSILCFLSLVAAPPWHTISGLTTLVRYCKMQFCYKRLLSYRNIPVSF